MTLGDLTLIEWRNPWWLLLALQPWAITLWLNLRRARVAQYAEAPLWPWALRGADVRTPMSLRRVATLMLWGLFAVAAAGPRLPLGTAESGATSAPFHGGDLMVLLDVSPSMVADDVAPRRLQRAHLELHDLRQRLRGERVGLIAFSGDAGLLAPLTNDYEAFAHYLARAEGSLFKTPGTNYAAALDLALHALPPAGDAARAVLLITDGDSDALSGGPGATALAAAQRLKEAGIAFYILAVGARDSAALQALANTADGTLEMVRDGDGDWRTVYDRGLLTLPGASRPPATTQQWLELYPGFLLAALMLLLISTVKVRAEPVAVLLFALVLLLAGPSEPVSAAEPEHTQAWRAYRDGHFAQAQLLFGELQGFDARMGEGAAAYRRKNFAVAIEQFTAALVAANSTAQRADALFNLGNGYFQSADYRAAADAYADVLRQRPGDSRAQTNLDLTTTRLKQARVADPNVVGVLGRRGPQTGGELGEEIGDRPVMLEPSAEDDSRAISGAPMLDSERARPAEAADGDANAPRRAEDSDRLHRAALKKLELVTDRSADLLREIIKRDTPRMAAPPPSLPPW